MSGLITRGEEAPVLVTMQDLIFPELMMWFSHASGITPVGFARCLEGFTSVYKAVVMEDTGKASKWTPVLGRKSRG